MDAVKFGRTITKICDEHNGCENCPFDKGQLTPGADCFEWMIANINRAVEIAEQWEKDHPAKTRQSEFLKMFPNTLLDDIGVIHVCPNNIDTTIECQINANRTCNDCRRDYWLQEVE